ENHRFCLYRDQFAVGEVQSDSAERAAITNQNLDHSEIADAAKVGKLAHFAPQRRGNGRSGIEKIDIAAALDAVTWCHLLLDVAVLARPARAPLFHFENARRSLSTQERRECFIAEPASRLKRVGKM